MPGEIAWKKAENQSIESHISGIEKSNEEEKWRNAREREAHGIEKSK